MRNDEHLLNLYRLGEAGENWYKVARDNVAKLSEFVGYSADYVSGVIAVLSPRVQVSRNARMAFNYLTEGTLHGVMRTVQSALLHYELSGEIRGPKTSPFARAINPDDPTGLSAVVVDVWTWRIFYPQLSFGSANVGRRERIKSRVTNFARLLDDDPANVQARLWTGFRYVQGHTKPESNLSWSL